MLQAKPKGVSKWLYLKSFTRTPNKLNEANNINFESNHVTRCFYKFCWSDIFVFISFTIKYKVILKPMFFSLKWRLIFIIVDVTSYNKYQQLKKQL